MTPIEVELPCLTNKVKRDLFILAMQGMPNEVCGIIHPHGIIHQYPNTFAGDKSDGFDMVVRDSNLIVAIWHSHPGGTPRPSRDDVPIMQTMAEQGFPQPWIIITTSSVIAWELPKNSS